MAEYESDDAADQPNDRDRQSDEGKHRPEAARGPDERRRPPIPSGVGIHAYRLPDHPCGEQIGSYGAGRPGRMSCQNTIRRRARLRAAPSVVRRIAAPASALESLPVRGRSTWTVVAAVT